MADITEITNVLASIADGDLIYFGEDLGGSTYDDAAGTALTLKNYVLTGPLAVIGSASAGASIRLPEDTDNGSHYVAIKAPDSLAGTYTLTLPDDDGDSGEVLSTNGSGVLSWVTGGGSIAPLVVGTDVVDQRNGTTAQAFRVYNTYTDGSNYERAIVRWDTNVLRIGTDKAGTGSSRSMQIYSDSTIYICPDGNTTWGMSSWTSDTLNLKSKLSVGTNAGGDFFLQSKASGWHVSMGTGNAANSIVCGSYTNIYFLFFYCLNTHFSRQRYDFLSYL